MATMENMQIIPASRSNVEAQFVEMKVPLYSHGCERKVKKALSSLKGIYSVNVDYIHQKVVVWGICNKYDVLETIKSKRKKTCFWNIEDNDNVVMENREPSSSSSSSSTSSPPPAPPPPGFPGRDFKPALTKVRSLSIKAWKKVFIRSFSSKF